MKLSTAAILTLCISTNTLFAAEKRAVKDIQKVNSIMSQQDATVDDAQLKNLLGLSPDSENLKERKRFIDKNGDTTIRYTQTYRNLPVIGDDIIITRNRSGEVTRAHGYAIN